MLARRPEDYSIENYARLAAEVATNVGADVVVGFSIGASVALEMVASRGFAGPVVLLGIALSTKDEPAFFWAIVRSGVILGSLPVSVLAKGAGSMVKRIPVSAERQGQMREDLRKNVPQHMRHALNEYARWLQRNERPAERLCQAGVPTWIIHAEKGDGGLTADERRTFESCPHAHLVTIPGHVFFLPNEVPEQIAGVVLEAVAQARRQRTSTP